MKNITTKEKKTLNFSILLRCTNEIFHVTNISIHMKIRDLKGHLEFICGIPSNIQKLCYLDEGEMVENKDIQYYDVIEGALINMDVYTIYVGLVRAAVSNNFDELLKQGVSTSVEWKSPTSDYMFQRDKVQYIADRAGIALFICAHRGFLDPAKKLIESGTDVNYATNFGRTPIMVSVVAAQTEIISLLLSKNADIDVEDIYGDTAIDIAKKFKNKIGQHSLIEFKWKKRANAYLEAQKNKVDVDDRLPYMMYDSSQKTWLKGDFSQIYMAQLVKPGEFSGTGISAPKALRPDISPTRIPKEKSDKVEDKPKLKISKQKSASKSEATNAKTSIKSEQIKKKETNSNKKVELMSNKISNDNSTTSVNNEYISNSTKTLKPSLKVITNAPINIKEVSNLSSDYDVYQGMSYDEWIPIRDNFLQSRKLKD